MLLITNKCQLVCLPLHINFSFLTTTSHFASWAVTRISHKSNSALKSFPVCAQQCSPLVLRTCGLTCTMLGGGGIQDTHPYRPMTLQSLEPRAFSTPWLHLSQGSHLIQLRRRRKGTERTIRKWSALDQSLRWCLHMVILTTIHLERHSHPYFSSDRTEAQNNDLTKDPPANHVRTTCVAILLPGMWLGCDVIWLPYP